MRYARRSGLILLVLAYLVGGMARSVLADENGRGDICAKHQVPEAI